MQVSIFPMMYMYMAFTLTGQHVCNKQGVPEKMQPKLKFLSYFSKSIQPIETFYIYYSKFDKHQDLIFIFRASW